MALAGSPPNPFTTLPTAPMEKKPGYLSDNEIKQFFKEGFVIIKDFFKQEELQPCIDAIDELVDELANKLYNAGKISELYTEYGVFQRLTELNKAFPGASILMFKMGKFHKAFQELWCNERLLNMVEQIIGPDVAGHPVWNLRPKIPKNTGLGVVVPWHQDSGYFSADSYDHMVVTTWIPFLDTNEHNGGMQMVKYGHRNGKCAKHTCCQGDTWYITLEEEEMEKTLDVNMEEDVVTCEVPFGGFLLFNNLTPHRSLPNNSNDVRWSIDLRWQSPFEKWGFYDIQEGIIFRSSEEQSIKPDWKKFLSVNRKKVWQEKYTKKVEDSDEFDTTVTGPWIGRWDLVNHNRHTAAFSSAIHL